MLQLHNPDFLAFYRGPSSNQTGRNEHRRRIICPYLESGFQGLANSIRKRAIKAIPTDGNEKTKDALLLLKTASDTISNLVNTCLEGAETPGGRVLVIAKQKGVTKIKLAEALSLSRTTFYRHKLSGFNAEERKKMAERLNVPLWLIEEGGDADTLKILDDELLGLLLNTILISHSYSEQTQQK